MCSLEIWRPYGLLNGSGRGDRGYSGKGKQSPQICCCCGPKVPSLVSKNASIRRRQKVWASTIKMSVNHKILRSANAPTTAPDETETSVAQALIDLENNVPELKAELRPLQISAAREVDVRGGKKAIVIFVPVPQLKAFHKVQQRLTRELEKKFSDRHVVFVAQRRMLRKPTRSSRVKQKRPRSRTLTSVHEKILEDLVFPTEIVGKRTRVAVDGSKLLKVFLDSKDATSLEYKLDSFSSVYRRLTGKDVVFEFPVVAPHVE
ncbi:40S ribosomal protein S7 [Hypsizygus marmoreus]|uniref:40S ribosomal protein S7 n=1 Tax=Hypsizygus marmoreus TaxID=39966 RepID=A0A369JF09_HYPMA|nr:40S ribosomal protein S7 [Hypsizygus marmoreus]